MSGVSSMSFLKSLAQYVQVYADEREVNPDAVKIRMTLSVGSQFETTGVKGIETDVEGVALIRGATSGASLVIHDARILHAQVDLAEPARPIGFHAEKPQ